MKRIYYIKRLLQIPVIELKLLIKGYFLCLLLLPVVYLLPLKYYIDHLKIKSISSHTDDEKRYYIRLVRKTLRRITRFSPIPFTCLIKSATFKLLLNDFGVESSLALGLKISKDRLMKAHAYVSINKDIIYLKKSDFNEIFFI